MPCADAGVEETRLVRWLVAVGDAIATGDDIAILETPAGRRYDLRLYETGKVEALRVAAGTRVPVGTVILSLSQENPDHRRLHPDVRVQERYLNEPLRDSDD